TPPSARRLLRSISSPCLRAGSADVEVTGTSLRARATGVGRTSWCRDHALGEGLCLRRVRRDGDAVVADPPVTHEPLPSCSHPCGGARVSRKRPGRVGG